jgi:hypothetical protein
MERLLKEMVRDIERGLKKEIKREVVEIDKEICSERRIWKKMEGNVVKGCRQR